MAKKRPQALNGNLDQNPSQPVTTEQRHRMIAEAAYYRALHRGFSGGSAEDDWLWAEQEVNEVLLQPSSHARKSAHARAMTRPAPLDHENM